MFGVASQCRNFWLSQTFETGFPFLPISRELEEEVLSSRDELTLSCFVNTGTTSSEKALASDGVLGGF